MKKHTILVFIIGLLAWPFSASGLTIKSVDFMNVENSHASRSALMDRQLMT